MCVCVCVCVCCRSVLLAAVAFPFAVEKIVLLERRMQGIVQWINEASRLMAQPVRADLESAVTLCARAKADKVILLSYDLNCNTLCLIGIKQ